MRMAAGAVVQQNEVSLAVSLRREFVLSQNVPDYFGLELCRLASASVNYINCFSNIPDVDFLPGILMAMIEDCLNRNAPQVQPLCCPNSFLALTQQRLQIGLEVRGIDKRSSQDSP